MSEIISTVYKNRDLTILKVSGRISHEDVLAHTGTVNGASATGSVIWDFTDGDATGLAPARIPNDSTPINSYGGMRREGRTAFVFSREVDFGIGRMIENYLELTGFPVVVKSFRSMTEAYEWLGIEPPEKKGITPK